MVIRSNGFAVDLLGERLELEGVAYYTHHARVEDADNVRAELAAGTADGKKISIRPIDDMPWVIYAPSLLSVSGNDTVQTKPWKLRGVREHPGFERLPNREGG